MLPTNDLPGLSSPVPAGQQSDGLLARFPNAPTRRRVFREVRRFATLDSTNSYLVREARLHAPEGLVVVADHQEAGRGRLDRRWLASPGSSLLVSMLMRPGLAADRLHLCSAVVALAVTDACREVAEIDVGIKWPNDVMVRGRKLAGILSETFLDDGVRVVVAGLGLNLKWSQGLPEEIATSATSLAIETGRDVGREEFLDCFLNLLEDRYQALASFAGQRRQVKDYRRCSKTIGRRVRVEIGEESFAGKAVDITLEGHLLVDVGDSVRTVVAGDVVHLRPLDGA